jgi:hypothetical protein
MNVFTLLNLRSRFESVVKDGRYRYDLPNYDGTIETLEWFVKNGHKSNRFRKHFDELQDIAETILREYKK